MKEIYNRVAEANKTQLEDDLYLLMKIFVEHWREDESRHEEAEEILKRYGLDFSEDAYYEIQDHDFPEED